jgi:uncharacterized protein YdhG (YjbR/CyaY superfamily)
MKNNLNESRRIDNYIASFPTSTRTVLNKVRKTIRAAAPGAVEGISYGIPAFMLNGTYLVYFAGYKEHVSIYPVPKGTTPLNEKLAAFRTGKGTLQFPLDKAIPYALITRVVMSLRKDNAARAKAKGSRSRPR